MCLLGDINLRKSRIPAAVPTKNKLFGNLEPFCYNALSLLGTLLGQICLVMPVNGRNGHVKAFLLFARVQYLWSESEDPG